MRGATAEELAEILRRDKASLLAEWERQVRKLPRERKLSAPVLRDHVPGLIGELIRDLEQLASSARVSSISRFHGAQRQTAGLDVSHVVEEYKLLRACIVDRVESCGLSVAGDAGRLLNKLIDDGIKAAVAAHVAQHDEEERTRREEYLKFIVHDLRSPLTAIQHAMLLLERRLAKGRATKDDRSVPGMVRRNIERMQALIVKLLQEERNVQLGSNIAVRRSASPLRPLVERARETLSPSAKSANAEIINEVQPDIVVNGDTELLERVFQYLISNAIDYSPKGTVRIGASVADDGGVVCWVADNGRGIPEDIKPEVFEKYRTTRRRHGGMGLGLAVVRQIVEAHGGTVQLQSDLGMGTTVRFTIPRPAVGDFQPAAEL